MPDLIIFERLYFGATLLNAHDDPTGPCRIDLTLVTYREISCFQPCAYECGYNLRRAQSSRGMIFGRDRGTLIFTVCEMPASQDRGVSTLISEIFIEILLLYLPLASPLRVDHSCFHHRKRSISDFLNYKKYEINCGPTLLNLTFSKTAFSKPKVSKLPFG
jgi:hypothetical protein